ncbi:MAG: hypothetical protein Q6373_004525 [Candidatus Sigynarchaeota archaeon]
MEAKKEVKKEVPTVEQSRELFEIEASILRLGEKKRLLDQEIAELEAEETELKKLLK